MKVLMIAPTPFFNDRGCHTQIYEEIKSLQKLGHEIILCTYGLGRDMPGVRTVRTLNMPWYKKLSAGPSFTKILMLPFLTITTMSTIIWFRPQVIHAHLHEGALIARFCKLFFWRKKYLFDMQGSLSGETLQHGFVRPQGLFHKFLEFLEHKIANWFFVITQSESMIKELDGFGVPENKRRNVNDGVDTDIFKPMSFNNELAVKLGINGNNPRVLYMGLLEQYQGVDIMFKAFKNVLKKIPSVQFIVIGFPNIDNYQKMCETLGIGQSTKFLGKIDYTILADYLALSSIAIAPKIAATEGDGKIYNYMAMGMCTVTFDRSVSREILGETGVYAEMENPEDMAEKIIWAIEHPKECGELGRKSRERAVKNLSWDAVGKRINEVYLSL